MEFLEQKQRAGREVMRKEITLKPGRERSAVRLHPWIFSGAVASLQDQVEAGDTVAVRGSDGSIVGVGTWSPESQIRVRLWSFDPECVINGEFIDARVARAVGNRAVLMVSESTNAYRLINAEGDGMPGVTVDRYGEWLVCQFTTCGAERWKSEIVTALQRYVQCRGIYERSDADIRSREGLEPAQGVLCGDEPPELIEIVEHGCRYLVDVRKGQKTGFYLDQRNNREIVRCYANGCRVLNCFSYTGGFGITALSAGAESVTHVELSASALALARENTALNTCHVEESTFTQGSVFEVLRKMRDSRQQFDLIILDPPKFVDSKATLMKGARGYKDINLLAMKLLAPGGYLATCSCSGAMTGELFRKVVSDAAVDARREVQIVHHLHQAEDHPEALCLPESQYLKGFLVR